MRISGKLPRFFAALAAVAALAACADTPTGGPSEPARSVGPAADTLAPAPDTIIYEGEQEYEEVARQVPGYGGHWYNEQGDLVVRLTDLSQEGLALRVIGSRPQPDLADGERRTGVTRFIQSRYDFATLRDLRNRVTFSVLAVDSVALLDLDEEHNRLLVGLAGESARPQVEAELAKAGVPLGAAAIVVTGAPEAYQTLQNFFRPLQSGYQIQNAAGGTCTLGVPSVGPWPAYITNSHCTQAFWWNTGTNFFQNVVGAPFFIGTEAFDPAGWGCFPFVCRWSDAARINVAANVPAANQVARTAWFGWHWAAGSINTGGIPAFNNVGVQWWPGQWQLVDKVGRTTGWNKGFVTNTCVSVVSPIPGRLVLCQYLMTNGAGPGDSGSPVFRQFGNGAQITGLLWGGMPAIQRTIFSPRGGVFADLLS